jgi:hypothetical protein
MENRFELWRNVAQNTVGVKLGVRHERCPIHIRVWLSCLTQELGLDVFCHMHA